MESYRNKEISFNSLNSRILRTINLCIHCMMWGPCVLIIVFWGKIPEQVAQHFNGRGEIDRTGEKSILFMIILLIFIFYCFHLFSMYVMPYLIGSADLFGSRIARKITLEDIRKGVIVILKLIAYLDFIFMTAFLYILWHTIRMIPLGEWFVPVLLGAIIFDFILFFYRYFRLRRKITEHWTY